MAAVIPASCRDRHHRWTMNPPVVGTPCSRCPATYGGPGHRKAKPNGSNGARRPPPLQLTEADVAEIFPASAGAAPELPPGVSPGEIPPGVSPGEIPPPAPGEPVPIPSWCPLVAKRLAPLFVIADRWIIERGGKLKANEPNESTVDDFAEGCAEQLAVWFPDAELSPWKKIMVAAIAIHGEARIGAKRVIDGAPAGTHPARPAATSTETAAAMPGPPPVPAGVFPPGMFGA